MHPLKKPDPILLGLTIILTLFGILMVYNASVVQAYDLFGDKFRFLKLQALWAAIGFVMMGFFTFFPIHLIKKLSPVILAANILLLVLVLIPGVGSSALGARRWINLFGFTLQPTELIKLSLSIYLSAWLIKDRPFWSFASILALILLLVMLQPDLGTAIIIIATALMVFYVSGASLKYFVSLVLIFVIGGTGLIFSSPYRKQRLMTFLNPTADPLGSSYHIRQALIAIGSGGVSGLGLGQSRQKYQFLPEVTTDSIFAIIAEETGLIGSSFLLLLLFAFTSRSFYLSLHSPDKFSQLLSAGIASWLGFQISVNLAAMLALVPLTGIPLPFISYGGSSLMTALMGTGMLLNISRFRVNNRP